MWMLPPSGASASAYSCVSSTKTCHSGLSPCQPRGLSVLRAGGWESTELTDLTIEFSDMQSAAGGRINRSVWSYKQQGFLKTQTSTLYTCKEDLLVQPRHDGGPACTGPGTAGPCTPHDCR